MNENQTIYGFDNSGCKHEVYSKDNVYTKTEIDNTVTNINNTTNSKINTTVLKDDIAVIYGQVTVNQSVSSGQGNLYYPEGFTPYNSVIIAKEYSLKNNDNYISWIDSECIRTWNRQTTIDGIKNFCTVTLKFPENATELHTYDIRIVLMKIPNYIEGVDYTLGDVNEDGEITLDDATKIQNYINDGDSLTAQQFAAADIDKNGKIQAVDYIKLKNYVEGTTSSLSD